MNARRTARGPTTEHAETLPEGSVRDALAEPDGRNDWAA